MDRELFLEKLKKYWEANEIPNISKENAMYLRWILKENKVQHLLEIGSANGYSTINFAIELEKTWWKITSIEFSQLAFEEAWDNFHQAWVSQIIKHYFWDARDILPLLEEKYDFIFIDGLKKESLNFLKIVWNMALPWATIIIDDVIKFRYKMESLYDYVEAENLDYSIVQIDSDDGIMIIKKPRD